MRVPFLRGWLPPIDDWAPLLEEAYAQDRFSNFGPLHERFCGEIEARYCVAGYRAVLVSNATAGLTAVLLALGVRGVVVLPSFTFPATLHAVIQAGCTPHLCDADPATWEMDLEGLRRLLAQHAISAVVPVRSYGFVRDQSRLLELCRERGCAVIIDGAASLGHPGRTRAIGSQAAEIEIVSLHATKTFSIGEGGIVFAPEPLARTIRAATNFGLQADRTFLDGGNMKVDEVRSAIGLAALRVIDDVVQARVRLAERYHHTLARHAPKVRLPIEVGATPWQSYPVRFATNEMRDRVADRLAACGIETRKYYSPTVAGGYIGGLFEPFDVRQTPVAEELSRTVLCLPLYHTMSSAEQDFVIERSSDILLSLD